MNKLWNKITKKNQLKNEIKNNISIFSEYHLQNKNAHKRNVLNILTLMI